MTIENTTDIRFIADAMFGKLALYLRLLGFDTELAGKTVDIDDDKIIELLRNSQQILITRDQALSNKISKTNWGKNRAVLLDSRQIEDQLVRVFQELQLSPSIINLNHPELLPSRCSECNHRLEVASVAQVLDQIPSDTAQHITKFWRCVNPKCRKIFWIGSHWQNILKALRKVYERLETKT
jgi:uncharacterized protein with PIN domain